MKKIIAMLLLLSLLLCGCGSGKPAETTVPPTTEAPTEEPTAPPTTVPPTTEAPTEAPTEPPVPTNPLTGETLEAPSTTRTFAVTINNVPAAMPLFGVNQADIFFEMFVNDYSTRGLALYSDMTQVQSIGSVRSLRYNFTDLCQSYDAVMVHAGGNKKILNDFASKGLDNINVGLTYSNYYYRDQNRLNSGYALEHTLMVRGAETVAFAESNGIRIDRPEDADYGLHFTEDGTPAEGETANAITIKLTINGVVKSTVMHYDAEKGKYQFHQYGRPVYDALEQQYIGFTNVLVMFCPVNNQGVYHVADLVGEGDGYFACGGKLIPIKWSHESLDQPILFTLEDGTPLELSVGNTYIAIAPLASPVEWE